MIRNIILVLLTAKSAVFFTFIHSIGSCGEVFGGDIFAATLQHAAIHPQQHIKGNKIQKQIKVINAIMNGVPGQ